jgi:hydrogenase nickel incorporation protein HypA/HybF
MHELPITQNVLEIAERHAKIENAYRVTNIYLVIGELSTVIDESVQFYWDIVSKDSICEGAVLHFKRTPATFKCKNCQHTYMLTKGELSLCPQCDSFDIDILTGKDFRVEAIDIETK